MSNCTGIYLTRELPFSSRLLEEVELDLLSWRSKSSTDEAAQRMKASQKIIVCLTEGTKTLDLTDLQLTTLPDCLWELTHITTLNISHNRLRVIDEAVGNLVNLQIFLARENAIASLPASFDTLPNLKIVEMSLNNLEDAPKFTKSALKIKKLYFDENRISLVPRSWRSLKNIEILDMSSNGLASLPPYILGFPHLKRLAVHHNQIEYLPPPPLRHFRPPLREIDLDYNCLRSLPLILAGLPSRCTILVEGNPISEPARRIFLRRIALHREITHRFGPRINFFV